MASQCFPIGGDTSFLLNAFFHVFVLILFLTIFFTKVISKIEKDTLSAEIEYEVNENLQNALKAGDSSGNIKEILSTVDDLGVFQTLDKMYSQPDAEQEMHNKWLFGVAIGSVAVLFIMCALFAMTLSLSCGQCIPITHIVVENLIIFSGIGIVEYVFFTNIALKYIPTKPSLIVKSAIEALKDSINSSSVASAPAVSTEKPDRDHISLSPEMISLIVIFVLVLVGVFTYWIVRRRAAPPGQPGGPAIGY